MRNKEKRPERGSLFGGRVFTLAILRWNYNKRMGFSFALRGRPVTVVPRLLLRAVGLMGDLIGKLSGCEFLIHSSRYRSMVTSETAPMAATYALLGPSPISLDQAVDETVRWLRTYEGHDGLRF